MNIELEQPNNHSTDIELGNSNNSNSNNGNGVQLSFRNIVYRVPNKLYGKENSMWNKIFKSKDGQEEDEETNTGKPKPPLEKEITILHGVSGVVEPGEIVAIMGPSGSGKSTLMDILAKRKSTGTITGQLLVNGREVGDAYKNYCSYVTQEDILLPTSTVEETLRFYADLRLSGFSGEEKDRRVAEVLQDIGLSAKAKSKVGGMLPGGIMLRGLSGGEKRRVSIGCGLVTNPNIIFLDEPTSGLDSVAALVVMNTLTSLTKKGVTVIASIHQPRTEIFSLFKKIMVVVKGRMIYAGTNILDYFDGLGYSCPAHVNPADFCLDSAVAIGESSRYLEICDKWLQHWESEVIANTTTPDHITKKRKKPSFSYQFKILLHRSYKDFWRNPGNFGARSITAVVVGLLFGACFGGLTTSQNDIQKIIGVIFFLISGLNLTPFTSISLFLSGRALFNAERAAKIYHPFPYFIAMMLVEFIVVFVVAIALGGITYGIANLRADVGRFFFAMMVYLFVHILSDLCIIWITNTTGTSDHTFAIGSGLSVIYQLFAGFFVPVQQLPVSFGWLHYLNPLYYGFASVMVNEFEDRELICPTDGTPCLFPNGNDVLKYYGLDHWTRGNAFGVVVMVLFTRSPD
ncbi:ABC transporter G family protein [Cavenderia fasciculata]|uniref:ABC transporter G family protein n=1 Tax=Cavenderia fasciculata TaxID=261658 RepID=F4QFV0_CACFS|nr:ABC transporter G family protein [Cavenderia fasciculata]EGG14347.1 ABC transporter G family protein [Cavenderia fasciculata]|eukprot:XP_004351058.1 ABC transporter G family protein [Cavenderia fasciculata]